MLLGRRQRIWITAASTFRLGNARVFADAVVHPPFEMLRYLLVLDLHTSHDALIQSEFSWKAAHALAFTTDSRLTFG